MLDELSPALRHECMHHIYAKILIKVPFLRDSPQIVQSAVIACVKPVLCCKKDYLVIEGQVLNDIFLVASGAIEVINNRGLVSRTYGVGSFFGEKCAFHTHYLSTVSYRAKVDLEVLTIERNDFVDLLNTYEAFGETFMMICAKREDHKKGHLQKGQTRMTGKLSKNAASMVRPVTPPPGTTWKKITSKKSQSVYEKVKEDTATARGADIPLQKSRTTDVFDDVSLPALLDKMQYNIGSQLDDIQDHLDHLEDRLEMLEIDQHVDAMGGPEIRFLDGTTGIRKPISSHTLATVSTTNSGMDARPGMGRAQASIKFRDMNPPTLEAANGGEAADTAENILTPKGMSRRRLVQRENSRFKAVQSQRNVNSSPHEY